MTELIRRLARDRRLTRKEYETLIRGCTPQLQQELAQLADRERRAHYGTTVFIRAAMEISSICKNDCLYCAQRRSSPDCQRYRLRPREILERCEEAGSLDVQSFLLRGGEDGFYNDEILESLILRLKERYPGCAVTLALGERGRESFERLYNAGADRYLLRHEAADRQLYEQLHPAEMSYDLRLHALNNLKDIGYQTGCGFIVGLPGQTPLHLARDLKYIQEFQPHMVDVGPFLPQPGTPFADFPAGSGDLTNFMISLIRIIRPDALITAPADLEGSVLAGANVVCWSVYPAAPSNEALSALRCRIADIGFEASTARGDCAAYSI